MARPTAKHLAQRTLILLFLLGIFLPFLGTILAEKKEVSLHEKRRLALFPKISPRRTALNALPKALEEYCRDHLFLRDNLVRLNALLQVRCMRKSPTFMVIVGRDGWYYYTGDWALHDFLGQSDKNDEATTRAWEANLGRRASWLQDLGGRYLVAIAPNKESVHLEFLPDRIRHLKGMTMLDALQARLRDSPHAAHFLDLTATLRQAKEAGPVYHRTDSLWNSRGAYAAYREIIERVRHWYPEVVPLPEERLERRPSPGYRGDLPPLMGLVEEEGENHEFWTATHPCASPQGVSYTSELLPNGVVLAVNGCPQAVPRRVLVISDSFIVALQEYLAETFQEVVFSRDINLQELRPFITHYRPDLILQVQVGRYLPRALGGEQ